MNLTDIETRSKNSTFVAKHEDISHLTALLLCSLLASTSQVSVFISQKMHLNNNEMSNATQTSLQ